MWHLRRIQRVPSKKAPLLCGARSSNMQLRFSPSLLAVRDLLCSSSACRLRHGRSPAGPRLPNITRYLSSASFPSAASAPLPFSSAAEDAGSEFPCPAVACVSTQLLQSESASPRTAACVPVAGSSHVSASLRPPACSSAAASSPAAAAHSAAAATPSSIATSATAAAGSSANLQGVPVVQEAEPTPSAGAEVRALCCCFSACRLLQRRLPLNILAVRRLCSTAGVREAEAAASARASLLAAASTPWNLVSRKATVPAATAGLQAAETAGATNAAAAPAAETSARLACAAAGETPPATKAAAAAAAAETAGGAADACGRATCTAKTSSALRGGRGARYCGIVTEVFAPAATIREDKAGEERLLFHSAAARPLSFSAGNTPARTGNRTSASSASPAAAAGPPAASSRPSSSSSTDAAAAASAAEAASSLPNASASSSATAGGQQPPQQTQPDVPFVKKREMNLKAGPYRRGRIFISPREDPLEFVLSCLVVFVMLYTLYKLPRGEYLWERRKRVIRERLLKEYGLTEEDLENADSE